MWEQEQDGKNRSIDLLLPIIVNVKCRIERLFSFHMSRSQLQMISAAQTLRGPGSIMKLVVVGLPFLEPFTTRVLAANGINAIPIEKNESPGDCARVDSDKDFVGHSARLISDIYSTLPLLGQPRDFTPPLDWGVCLW
jgi:hypothetical protein